MVENGWKLHLDDDLDFVNKSDEMLVFALGTNLKVAMLRLVIYATAAGVVVAAFVRYVIASGLVASQLAVAGGQVVFLGDSIVAGMDVSAIAPSAINMGVGGDTTAAILARVGKVPGDATAIVLEGGINDLRRGWRDDQVVANYERILARLPRGARIYLVGVLPVDEKHLSVKWWLVDNQKIADVNADLATLCRRFPNCVVIPPLLALGPNDTIGDGVHPSVAGYAKIAMEWRAILRNH